MGDLAHHAPDRSLEVLVEISTIGEDVEAVALVVVVRPEGKVLRAETLDVLPVGGTSTSHHLLHGSGIGDIRVSREVESELRHENPGIFQISMAHWHSTIADRPFFHHVGLFTSSKILMNFDNDGLGVDNRRSPHGLKQRSLLVVLHRLHVVEDVHTAHGHGGLIHPEPFAPHSHDTTPFSAALHLHVSSGTSSINVD